MPDRNSGDKPLATALEMMYNEAVTSLPVLDNQKNVVGNISLADVRVCFLPSADSADDVVARDDKQREGAEAAPRILHCIHIGDPVRARRDRRQGHLSCILRQPILHTGPHCGQTGRHTVAQVNLEIKSSSS